MKTAMPPAPSATRPNAKAVMRLGMLSLLGAAIVGFATATSLSATTENLPTRQSHHRRSDRIATLCRGVRL
jgi:hypothetical protein